MGLDNDTPLSADERAERGLDAFANLAIGFSMVNLLGTIHDFASYKGVAAPAGGLALSVTIPIALGERAQRNVVAAGDLTNEQCIAMNMRHRIRVAAVLTPMIRQPEWATLHITIERTKP